MQDFQKLVVWQKAHRLTLDVHRALEGVPRGRYAGLRSQCLRAASSIPANVAEGTGKRTSGETARYLDIAMGSLKELTYHLILARDLGLIEASGYERLAGGLDEIRRMLVALSRAVRRSGNTVSSRESGVGSQE